MTTSQTTKTTNTTTAAAYDANGSFVWFELRTPQAKKSLAFFTEALGWKTQTMNMGQGDYTMVVAGEEPVGGIVDIEKGPASFVSYVFVNDVDAAADRVKKAGGTVVGAAFDVPTIGRMVEVKDQDGAAFFLYKGLQEQKAPSQAPGTFHWNELWAKDEKRAISFLTSVIGYSVQAMPMPGMTYNLLTTKNGPVAGVWTSPSPNVAPSWLPYVHVSDCDATVARAKKLGASLEGEITEVPDVGRMAILIAPDGARFAVMKPVIRK